MVNIFPLGESSQEPCDFSRGRFRTSGLHINIAAKQLAVFEEKIKEGMSNFYARCFAKAIGRGTDLGKAKMQAEIAEKLLIGKKFFRTRGVVDEIEVFHYAELITNDVDKCLAKKSAQSLGIEAGLYKRVFC